VGAHLAKVTQMGRSLDLKALEGQLRSLENKEKLLGK
jgi:hypothetical protein